MMVLAIAYPGPFATPFKGQVQIVTRSARLYERSACGTATTVPATIARFANGVGMILRLAKKMVFPLLSRYAVDVLVVVVRDV